MIVGESDGLTVRVNCFVIVAPAVSANCMVNVDVLPVGVPEINPLLAVNVRPAGKDPVEIDHVNGEVPPDSMRVVE